MTHGSPEQQIQRAVFEHLAIRGAPKMFAFDPANGGWRSPIEAAILKGLGVRAGVPTAAGVTVSVAYGPDDALAQLEAWGRVRASCQGRCP
jgi:hypothetical protein